MTFSYRLYILHAREPAGSEHKHCLKSVNIYACLEIEKLTIHKEIRWLIARVKLETFNQFRFYSSYYKCLLTPTRSRLGVLVTSHTSMSWSFAFLQCSAGAHPAEFPDVLEVEITGDVLQVEVVGVIRLAAELLGAKPPSDVRCCIFSRNHS